MIRKIRRKHKIVWLILTIILPIIFIASIVFRHNEPINEKIPEKFTTKTQSAQRN